MGLIGSSRATGSSSFSAKHPLIIGTHKEMKSAPNETSLDAQV